MPFDVLYTRFDYSSAWGLSIYFGSLGGTGRKILQKAEIFSGPLAEQLEGVLADVEADGVIVSNGAGLYRLV